MGRDKEKEREERCYSKLGVWGDSVTVMAQTEAVSAGRWRCEKQVVVDSREIPDTAAITARQAQLTSVDLTRDSRARISCSSCGGGGGN